MPLDDYDQHGRPQTITAMIREVWEYGEAIIRFLFQAVLIVIVTGLRTVAPFYAAYLIYSVSPKLLVAAAVLYISHLLRSMKFEWDD